MKSIYLGGMDSLSWKPELVEQTALQPIFPQELPAVDTAGEMIPQMDHKAALVIAAAGFVALEIVTLASMATQVAVIMSSLGLFVAALTVLYLFQTIRSTMHNRRIQHEQYAVLQDPYPRYRVHAASVGHEVCLQLKDYWPQHYPGQTPDYVVRVIQEERFGSESETQALERLVELQELAAEYERQAYTYYQSTHQAQEITGRLQNQLQQG